MLGGVLGRYIQGGVTFKGAYYSASMVLRDNNHCIAGKFGGKFGG